jgi:hypothetical protein
MTKTTTEPDIIDPKSFVSSYVEHKHNRFSWHDMPFIQHRPRLLRGRSWGSHFNLLDESVPLVFMATGAWGIFSWLTNIPVVTALVIMGLVAVVAFAFEYRAEYRFRLEEWRKNCGNLFTAYEGRAHSTGFLPDWQTYFVEANGESYELYRVGSSGGVTLLGSANVNPSDIETMTHTATQMMALAKRYEQQAYEQQAKVEQERQVQALERAEQVSERKEAARRRQHDESIREQQRALTRDIMRVPLGIRDSAKS